MSIITNFDSFDKPTEIKEDEATPAPAPTSEPAPVEEPAKAEETSAATTPAETPAEEPTETPEQTEHTYTFTWYGWVPSYKDFDQDWAEIKAKSDADAIKAFKESPSAKFTNNPVLDAIDGEAPKGSSIKFETQEDGSKLFKSVETDLEQDKFFLKVTKYPADYFTNSANSKKEITKEDIEPFFVETQAKPTETPEKPVEEQPAPEPAEESLHTEVGDLESKFEMVCDELKRTDIRCTATLTEDNIIIELGYRYPDQLAGTVWQVMDKCRVDSRHFSICAESHGHKAGKVIHINGGPQDWSMLNRYGRRY